MKQELAALRALGLTEYEARAYAALVAMGAPGQASAVAEAGPIPRTKVYAVLGSLERKGWIEVERGRPRSFRAAPPASCFARERGRLDALLDAALPSLEAQFADRSRRFAGPLWILQGEAIIAKRALEMVGAATQDVILVASFPMVGDDKLARAARAAVRRGVRVRVAAPDLAAAHVRALVAAGAEARRLALPPRVLAVDGRQALLCFPQPETHGRRAMTALWNPSLELMQLIGGVLSTVWADALPAPGT